MNKDIQELKQLAELARAEYRRSLITREEAQERIMPYINAVNERSKELAKKYNQKPRMASFNTFVR